MSEFLNRIAQYTPKRLALLADELNERLNALEGARHAPVAIVGIGCRFPGGADTPAKYWKLLREGVDAISEVPRERWDIDALFDADPDAPGKMSTRWGGFVGPVDGFDAHFFGISPREAQSMDPQQRLLLETTWRALEDAGISPAGLEGSRTGVFVGLSASDYYQLLRARGIERFDAYTASGTAHSIASGRLSYFLGLRGPSVSIDTACSSSLVAIHQAVQSLRRGECDVALAGGVNLILGPDITIALSKSHMMAPDGRCKTFDARADGFVRGEGCGMLVLKRADDAQADSDRVWAFIRGTAANQDGRSNGLTAPNGQAQEAVLRDAVADARCEPAAVGFVETHGTGTSLGDPIEVRALHAVLGAGREATSPLRVGSVKANIGHLESAAGVAGLIKAALALKHGEIPAQLHVQKLNPYIAWDEMAIEVPRAAAAWPARQGAPRLAGVSSFGFSGTNVHMILEEAAQPEVAAEAEGPAIEERSVQLLPVSARGEEALRAQLAAHADAVKGASLTDVAHALGTGRAHFTHRVGVLASTAEEAAGKLATASEGRPQPTVHCGIAEPRAPRIGFLFTGQGAQSPGMAQGLYRTEPVFREALERCDELLRPHLPKPLLEVLFPAPGAASPIDETAWTQPALFAVEYALAQMWMSWGVKPAMVMGHSVGEYVAACVAGAMALEDALRLIAARGRLMGSLPRGGAMAAVMASEADVAPRLSSFGAGLGIAAVNGPRNVVVSGRADAVEVAIAGFAASGVETTRIKVSHAFHSPLMAPMLDEFTRVAESVTYSAPRIELVSNVTGEVASGAPTAAYWRDHVMKPVQFARAIATMLAAGCKVLLEVGPHPTLLGMASESYPEQGPVGLPSLRRGRDDNSQVLETLAALYALGADIDWRAFDAGRARKRVTLPGYPFRRERHWIEHAPVAPAAPAATVLPPEPLRHMLHEVAWREVPAPDTGFADAATVAASVLPRLGALAEASGLQAYARFFPQLDRLSAAYVVVALRELGLALKPGERFETEATRARLGVGDRHRRLFARMLEILREDGHIVRDGDGWRVVAMPDTAGLDARFGELLAQHPDCEAELGLTRRCAAGLAGVVRGKADPLPLLFPEGSLAETERLYQNSPPARAFNGLIAGALEALLVAWPAGRRLRVLEIGAGTGSTTAYLLPRLRALPAGSVEYVFTDVSPLFLNRAREKFPDDEFLRTRVLDIGADPREQGFEAGGFDLVIGANVLHATPDLAATLARVRQLIAPGGRLVLLEAATPQRFGDLTVGLLDGWWCYTDTSRRDYALMPRARWLALLGETGFENAVALPGEDSGPVLRQQAVYLAEAAAAPTAAAGRYVVVPDRQGVAEALARILRLRGARVELLAGAEDTTLAAALREPCAGVVHLAALDAAIAADTAADKMMDSVRMLITGALATVQQLAAIEAAHAPALWLATRGAQATRAGEGADPAQATLWGFSHVVAMEHPELDCRRVDLDPAAGAEQNAQALAQALVAPDDEDQVALRAGRRLARRLAHLAPRRASEVAAHAAFDPERAYLVTGGMRGLGLLVARWLLERGAHRIALMGRAAPDARAREAIAALEAAGARVLAVQGDVSRRGDVESALARIRTELGPLAGIVHAAGVLDDGVIASQSWPRFATVMGPKVLGTWHLAQLAGPVDFLVLFSSGASLAGSAGQANHAAANAFEDALAWSRQAAGLRTVSINWGPWAEVGAAVDRAVNKAGIRAIAPHDGLAALEYAMRSARPGAPFATAQVGVLDTDWSHLGEAAEAGRLAPFFRELFARAPRAAQPRAAAGEAIAAPQSLRERLRAAMANRRRALLREHVRRETARVLGLAHADELDVQEPLRQRGLDSLMAVELRNRLGKAVERALPATLTFDHPTVAALVDHLAEVAFAEEIAAAEAPAPEAAAEAASAASAVLDDLTHDELAERLASRLDRLSVQENP